MSTLGAQARAAELAAAMSAQERLKTYREMEVQVAARQVSFNATDAMIPPKTPSVSLSAFMKPAPLNRNKGTKAWKPFDAGSFEDSSEDDVIYEKTEIDAASTTSNNSIASSSGASRPTVEVKQNAVTTGPRVIRLNIPQRTMPQHRHSALSVAPPLPTMVPVFPPRQPMMPQITTSAGMRSIQESPHSYVHNSKPAAAATTPGNNYMVPDDLSPTKQEIKFNALKAQQEESEANHFNNQRIQEVQQMMAPQQFTTHGGAFTESPSRYQPYSSAHVHRKGFSWDNETAYLMDTSYRSFPGFGNDGFVNPVRPAQIINGLNTPSRQHQQPRQQPYDTAAAMQKFLAEQAEKSKTDRGKTVLCNPELYKDVQKRCETNGKISRDIENHQGKASTSSLAIPQKRTASSPSNIFDPFTTPKRIFSEPTRSSRVDFLMTALSKAPEQLTLSGNTLIPDVSPPKNSSDYINHRFQHAYKPCEESSNDTESNASDNDRPLGERRGLLASFFELHPMTAAERKKTQECMGKAAKTVTLNNLEIDDRDNNMDNEHRGRKVENTFASNDPVARHNAITELMDVDPRGQAELRDWAQRTSVVHAVKRRSFAAAVAAAQANKASKIVFDSSNNSILGHVDLPFGYRLGIDDELIGSLALGDVACNLETYLDGSEENQAKFNHVHKVPEWCTERKDYLWPFEFNNGLNNNGFIGNGMYGSDRGGHSYFGDSWGVPPPRVARDPRFHAHTLRANVAGSEMEISTGMDVDVGLGINMGTELGGGMGGDVGIRAMSALEHERRRLMEAQMGRRPATMM